MRSLFPLAFSSLLVAVYCSEHTVTEEVYFDVQIQNYYGDGEDYRGRFVIGVFGETAPMTTMNFVNLAKGYSRAGETLHYKDTLIHRVVPDFVIQMGDVTTKDGTGGKSIYGDSFVDEDFVLSHEAAGYAAMANHGKDTNGSQFYIILNKARWLNGKHVVFGKVISGMDVINIIGEVKSNPNTAWPDLDITIIDSGVFNIERKYDLTAEQIKTDGDIRQL